MLVVIPRCDGFDRVLEIGVVEKLGLAGRDQAEAKNAAVRIGRPEKGEGCDREVRLAKR